MNVFSELSRRNTYRPNLTNAIESSEITYHQASQKLNSIITYCNSINLDKMTEKEIYSLYHNIAADLALCCEHFLKSIYIYENQSIGATIDQIWDSLAHPKEYYINNNGIVSFLNVDNNGSTIRDQAGNPTYIDVNGNILQCGTQGTKIKKCGHDLEHLVTMIISDNSRSLLDIIMTTNLIEETNKHTKIDIVDILANIGSITPHKKITDLQYGNWLTDHALTFVNARYAGQETPNNVEVEFLFHLATQCKTLSEHTIFHTRSETVSLTEEELKNIPDVISQLVNQNRSLVTQNLIKSAITDNRVKSRLEIITKNNLIKLFNKANPYVFHSLIKDFDNDEFFLICNSMLHCLTYNQGNNEKNYSNKILFSNVTPNELLNIFVYLKNKQKDIKINKDSLYKILSFVQYSKDKKYDYKADISKKTKIKK